MTNSSGGVVTAEVVGRSRRTALSVLVGCCAMLFFGNGVILSSEGTYITSVAGTFGVELSTVSLFVTIQGFVMLLSVPLMGRLMNRRNPRAVAVVAMGLMLAGYILFSVWPAVWGFYISGALIGVGAANVLYLAAPTFITAWFRTNTALFLSVASVCATIGQMISNPIASGLIATIGWRATYLTVGGVALVAGLLLAGLCLRNVPASYGLQPYGAQSVDGRPADPAARGGLTVRESRRTPAFVPLLVIAFIFGYGASIGAVLAPFAVTSGALPLAASGFALTGMTAGQLFSKLIGGRMYDKMRMGTTTLILAVIQAVGLVLLALVYVNPVFFFPGVFVMGLGMGATGLIAIPSITRITFGPKHFSAYFPWFIAAVAVATAIGGFVNNFVYDRTGSYALLFYTVAVAAVIAGLIALLVQSRNIPARWRTATTGQVGGPRHGHGGGRRGVPEAGPVVGERTPAP